MAENELTISLNTGDVEEIEPDENVFRRGIKDNPRKRFLARYKLWLDSIPHEYPMPYQPYRIGVYIRFYNQTKYSDEEYLSKHKQWFIDDIALCRKWTLVDFYIDKGAKAPKMESSPEWCRLIDDCLSDKIDLIVTQKASNVSDNPMGLSFICRMLACKEHPTAIYFISDDIFTCASYFREDISDRELLPEDWKTLPKDELDELRPEEDVRLITNRSDAAPNPDIFTQEQVQNDERVE